MCKYNFQSMVIDNLLYLYVYCTCFIFRTSRGPGNTFTSSTVGRVGYFSAIQKI